MFLISKILAQPFRRDRHVFRLEDGIVGLRDVLNEYRRPEYLNATREDIDRINRGEGGSIKCASSGEISISGTLQYELLNDIAGVMVFRQITYR